MRVSNKFFALMVIAVFWGVVFTGVFSGGWQSKMPGLEAAGVNSPAEIKGWMKVAEVSELFKVPVPELLKIWGVSAGEDPHMAVKDLARKYELETEDFRERLKVHLEAGGLVFAEEESSGDPNSNPDDIKGRMTFDEVAKNFDIPISYLFEKLGLPADQDPQMELRSVVETKGLTIETVREIVRNYPR